MRDYFSRRRRILEKSRVAQGLRWARADWRVRTCNASLGHAQPGPAAASPPPARSARGTARPGPARGAAARGGTGMEGMGWDGTGLGTTARPGSAQPARGGMGEASLPCPCAWGAQGVAAPEAKWPVPLRGAAGGMQPGARLTGLPAGTHGDTANGAEHGPSKAARHP